jgi:very-short-patch-repair endonuclease
MVVKSFEEAHKHWLETHLAARDGKRKERLEKGHSHSEILLLRKVWWPLFQNFDHLHPEYEVRDFIDGVRYLDFAYLRPPFRICIEIDGYSYHVENVTREQFADNEIRQDHLMADFWIVIRFSYDDIKNNPKRCQQVILNILGRLYREHVADVRLTPNEKEIIRIAIRTPRPITAEDVCYYIGCANKSARHMLKGLVDKRMLEPASGGTRRTLSYRTAMEPQLLLYMAG